MGTDNPRFSTGFFLLLGLCILFSSARTFTTHNFEGISTKAIRGKNIGDALKSTETVCQARTDDIDSLTREEAIHLLHAIRDDVCHDSDVNFDFTRSWRSHQKTRGGVKSVSVYEHDLPDLLDIETQNFPHDKADEINAAQWSEESYHKNMKDIRVTHQDTSRTTSKESNMDILMDIYQTFGGSNWIRKTGWGNARLPVCYWYGIECYDGCPESMISNNTCPIIGILLEANRLVGNITEGEKHMERLPYLIYIVLSDNFLYGDISDLNAPLLRYIGYKENLMSGSVPDYQNLPSLLVFDISYNKLEGQMSNFSETPLLQILSFAGNLDMLGTLPTFEGLPQLQEFYVSDTKISGTIPGYLHNPVLKTLYFSNNQLTGSPPPLSPIKNLVYIIIMDNPMTGTLPPWPESSVLEYIYYHFNQLTGTIPPLNHFPSLDYLLLHGNYLSGTFPGINFAPKMQLLYTEWNQLSGTIPNINLPLLKQFSGLKNQLRGSIPDLSGSPLLELFAVGSNFLTGTVPDFNMPLLKLILLEFNKISGTLPSFLNCASIEEIVIDNNNLSGTMPHYNQTSLTSFSLFNNFFSGTMPNFSNLPNLEEMYFMNNKFEGTIPDFQLPKLKYLYLGNNNMKGTIPNFRGLPSLIQLALMDNQLYGTLPNFDMKSLEFISINNNFLIGTLPNFRLVPKIAIITIQYNGFEGALPDFFNHTSLSSIQLSNNRFSGPIPKFENMPQIEFIDLSGNPLEGTIPDFQHIPSLKTLVLARTKLTGKLVHFSNLPNLAELSIYQNELTGTIPDFSRCPLLEKLELFENRLTGSIPIFQLGSLKLVDLSNNQLEGTLSPLLHIPSIETIDFSNNSISGMIPESFTSLFNLKDINLSYNQLIGSVPENFWILPNLNIIDFSNNRLSGEVGWFISPKYGPESIAYSYQYLYLDSNQLSGELSWWIYQYTPQIKVLSLSNNQITKLNDVSNLLDWIRLDVSGNPIEGPLPDSFINFVKIETLNVESTNMRHSNKSLLPSFATFSQPYELKSKRDTYLCPTIQSKYVGKSGVKIQMDSIYYDFVYCECLPNFYGIQNQCFKCPDECECTDGISIKGCFASPSITNVKFIAVCPIADACEQTLDADRATLFDDQSQESDSSCTEGYTGRVCSKCKEGYGHRGRTCVDCGDRSILATLILSPIALAGFIGALVHFSAPKSGKLNIVVFHIQTLSILYTSLTKSESLSQMIDYMFSFGSISIPTISCVMATTDALSPLLFSYGRLVVLLCIGLYFHHFLPSRGRNKVIYVSLTLLHIMYYQIIMDVFGVFSCTLYDEGDGHWYLNSAPWIQCAPASGEYLKMIALTVPVFVLFVAAFPVLVLKIMKNIEISDENATRDARYGFLYLPFKRERRYWELVILCRRILFSLIITVVPYTSQSVLYLLTILVIQKYRPYKAESENQMELISLFTIFVSFFCALLGSYQANQEWIGIAIILINAAVLSTFVAIPIVLPYFKGLMANRSGVINPS